MEKNLNFESFDSQWGTVEVAYQDNKITVHFTGEQEEELGRAEAEEIMQEYLEYIGETDVAGMAWEYVKGYYTAHVSELASVW